jgi:acyl dehydratase
MTADQGTAMSGTRRLHRPPRLAGLYLRALVTAGREPGGAVGALPELTLATTVDPARLARYRQACGFPAGADVPATFPHLLAFPLTLRLMTWRGFPAPALGLVHLRNSITRYRPVEPGEPLTVRAWVGEFGDHDRGTTIEMLAEATAGGIPAWYEQSIYLHRHRKRGKVHREPRDEPADAAETGGPGEAAEIWAVPANTGRRYAAVSGDRNPIHLSAATARPFGFRTAIAHGMWAKARCLAALGDLPQRYRVDVTFRRPVPLPGRVAFHRHGDTFALTGPHTGPHAGPHGRPGHLSGVIESAG